MTQALLLMDMQNGILKRVGAGGPYLDRVVATQERAEQADLLVVLVRPRQATVIAAADWHPVDG
jgi:nicotinamidase-related amidase